MPRRTHHPIYLLLLLMPLLAACAGGASSRGETRATATPQPTATAAPLTVHPQSLTIPGGGGSAMVATAHGLAFTLNSPYNATTPRSTVQVYDFASGKVTLVDSAPWDPNRPTGPSSGSFGTILNIAAHGDLLVYIKDDIAGGATKILAYNVVTHRTVVADSTPRTGGAGYQSTQLATDGTQVAWTEPIVQNSVLGDSLHIYDTATGQARTVASEAGFTYPSVALDGSTIVYSRMPTSGSGNAEIWRIQGSGAPQHVATAAGNVPVTVALSDTFIAWGGLNTSTFSPVSTLSAQAPATASPTTFPCAAPQLSGHYLLCRGFPKRAPYGGVAAPGGLLLFDVVTGASAMLDASDNADSIGMTPDRVLWFDTTIQYVTLPA